MSLGLLGAAYDSSSSNDSDDDDNIISDSNNQLKICSKKEKKKETPPPSLLSNPFKSQDLSSDSSSIIPKPSFMVNIEEITAAGNSRENSVFNNPFRAKEEKKRAILEKHVEMTTKQEEMKTIDGKKVCWNFRKGRCRFGHKCSFAHDSDVKLNKIIDPGESSSSVLPVIPNRQMDIKNISQYMSDEYDDSAVISNKKIISKRKRPGLSDDINPSKKAQKFHNKIYNK